MKKYLKKNWFVLLVIILFIVVMINIANTKISSNYGLISLQTSDWTEISHNNDVTLVYVGRESCSQCREFEAIFEPYLQENKLSVYYFDTDVNSTIKDEIIKKYNIIAVPSIVVLEEDDFYIIMDESNQVIIEQVSSIIQDHP